jgi:hypothetical protein
MSEFFNAAFAIKYPHKLPPWVDPFLEAVRRMEAVEAREQEVPPAGTEEVTCSDDDSTKDERDADEEMSNAEDLSDGRIDNAIGDKEMMRRAKEYLETVRTIPNDRGDDLPQLTYSIGCRIERTTRTTAFHLAGSLAYEERRVV